MAMRIVFMGTPAFACPSLDALLNDGQNVVAVVTAPDKPRGRGQEVSYTPLKEFALQKHLPVLQPESLKQPDFIDTLRLLQPDLFVVVAFRILPPEVFRLPPKGAFNLHASLLPKYRGAAPINWAIINGEKETGVTTFFLQEKVDTGNIILQECTPIGENETAGELHDRLAILGASLVVKTTRLIDSGNVILQPQDDSQATPAPKIFKNDCRIPWQRSAQEIHNFVRGLSPHPAAWTMHKGKLLKLYRTLPLVDSTGTPGRIVRCTPAELVVGTGAGVVSVLEIQQEGKRRLPIEEFLRGYKIQEGDTFE